jgi:hypothetical protein
MPRTYEPIASQTLGSNAATVTFSGIAGDWTDLILVCHVYAVAGANGAAGFRLRYNADTGSNYSNTRLQGDGSSATSARQSSQTYATVGIIPGTTGTGSTLGTTVLQIMSYSNTNVFKTGLSAYATNAFGSTEDRVGRYVSLWRSTSAITSIEVSSDSGDLRSTSTFSLYGVEAA